MGAFEKMKSMRKVITYIFSVAVVLVFIGAGYMIYRHYKKPMIPPVEAIPSSSLLFVEFENFLDQWNNLSKNNEIYSELSKIQGFKVFANKINRLDSVALIYPEIKNVFKSQKQYISVHPDSAELPSILFISGLPKSTGESAIVNFFYSFTGKRPSEIIEINGYSIVCVDDPAPFYYSINRGVFTGSLNKGLLIESLAQMNKRGITYDEDYLKVQETSGKNVDANIFINQSHFSELLQLAANDRNKGILQFMEYLASWTELDLILKSDEMLLNGYTSIDDSLFQYLGIFRNEKPQKTNVTRILPYNTNLLMHFGFSDFTTVHNKYLELLRNRGLYDNYVAKLSHMNNTTSRDILKYFIPWIGKEFALVITQTGLGQMDENIYTVINASNPERAKKNLAVIYDRNFVLNHKGYEIKKVYAPHIMSLLFGSLFEGYDSQYYTNIEDYFIFANSFAAIENYINGFESGKSLKNNINFKKFADNISDHSNILLYLNLRNLPDLHKAIP